LERVGNVLNCRERILLHVFYIRDGTIKSAFCYRVTRIHNHPTFKISAVTVGASGAGTDEWNSMVRHIKHVDESVAIEDIGAR
jgi:hypothetical protein